MVILFLGLAFLQGKIDGQRREIGLESNLLLMPGQIAGSLVLGGFKGLAADLLWLQVESLWHSGQHYRMLPIMNSITFLQPKFITPWVVGGWHMAYNMYVLAPENKKDFWLQSGIDFLKRGTTYNPNRYDLYFELAWTYYHKAKNYKEAEKYFELAAKFPCPFYVHHMLAHAYEKNGEIEKSIKKWEWIESNGPKSSKSIAKRIIKDIKEKHGR